MVLASESGLMCCENDTIFMASPVSSDDGSTMLLVPQPGPQHSRCSDATSPTSKPHHAPQPLQVCTGFVARKPSDSGSAGSDLSPQLVDVLASANALPAASSTLTAALGASTSTSPEPQGSPGAVGAADSNMRHAVSHGGEEDWEMVDNVDEHAANGAPTSAIGSFKDSLLKRLALRGTP